MTRSVLVFELFCEFDAMTLLERAGSFGRGLLHRRHFPDGETWLRVRSDCRGAPCLIVADLHQPDAKILPLIFLAESLRAQGAASVGLVAPYLPYMRQDEAFAPGEAVTSVHFAELLSSHADWLCTVDPHLHRHTSLSELFSISTTTISAAPAVAQLVSSLDDEVFLVGPDAESEQWVRDVAARCGVPYVIMTKERHGDRHVDVELSGAAHLHERRPVILDDIISTGHTMLEAASHLTRSGHSQPICVGIHAVFSDDAHAKLKSAGVAEVLTCNTISHPTNSIDVQPLLIEAISAHFD